MASSLPLERIGHHRGSAVAHPGLQVPLKIRRVPSLPPVPEVADPCTEKVQVSLIYSKIHIFSFLFGTNYLFIYNTHTQ